VSVATTKTTQETHTINRPEPASSGDVALTGETLGSAYQEAVPQLQREQSCLMPSPQHLTAVERGESGRRPARVTTRRHAWPSPTTSRKHLKRTTAASRLIVETGYIAEQANGAVMLRVGDTALLITAVASKAPREGIDFFPLTCDYEEKLYAAAGSPDRSPARGTAQRGRDDHQPDDRPPDAAALPQGLSAMTSRCRHRPQHRPGAGPGDARGHRRLVRAADRGIPHAGPVACVRVGCSRAAAAQSDSPRRSTSPRSTSSSSGTWDAIVMVEAGAHQISEHTMLDALRMAHGEIRKLVGSNGASMTRSASRP